MATSGARLHICKHKHLSVWALTMTPQEKTAMILKYMRTLAEQIMVCTYNVREASTFLNTIMKRRVIRC